MQFVPITMGHIIAHAITVTKVTALTAGMLTNVLRKYTTVIPMQDVVIQMEALAARVLTVLVETALFVKMSMSVA